MLGKKENQLLDELEEASDSIVKEEPTHKRRKHSDIILHFEIPEDEDKSTVKYGITKYINSKNFSQEDFFKFCTMKNNGDETLGHRQGFNIIQGLLTRRNFRVDTLDFLCEFLGVEIVIKPINKEE